MIFGSRERNVKGKADYLTVTRKMEQILRVDLDARWIGTSMGDMNSLG